MLKADANVDMAKYNAVNEAFFHYKQIGVDLLENILIIADNLTKHLIKTFKENEGGEGSVLNMALYFQNLS